MQIVIRVVVYENTCLYIKTNVYINNGLYKEHMILYIKNLDNNLHGGSPPDGPWSPLSPVKG